MPWSYWDEHRVPRDDGARLADGGVFRPREAPTRSAPSEGEFWRRLYQAVFLSAAALAAVSAIASWLTVRSSDTAPGPSDVSSTPSMACAPQSLTFSTFKE